MTLSGEGPPPFVPFGQGVQPGSESKGRSTENPKGSTCMYYTKSLKTTEEKPYIDIWGQRVKKNLPHISLSS